MRDYKNQTTHCDRTKNTKMSHVCFHCNWETEIKIRSFLDNRVPRIEFHTDPMEKVEQLFREVVMDSISKLEQHTSDKSKMFVLCATDARAVIDVIRGTREHPQHSRFGNEVFILRYGSLFGVPLYINPYYPTHLITAGIGNVEPDTIYAIEHVVNKLAVG